MFRQWPAIFRPTKNNIKVQYLNIVLSWPEDGRSRPKHVAKYNLILIIASCLDVCCVLTVHNILYNIWFVPRNVYTGLEEIQYQCTVVKKKGSRYRPGVAQRVGRGIALLFLDRGTRRGWVVRSTPWPHFTPRERPGTHFTGAWVGPRAGLEGQKFLSPPGFVPGPSSP